MRSRHPARSVTPGGGQADVAGAPSSELRRLTAAPRVPLADWPTPIDRHVDRDLGELLIKRDDLSGWGRGGAKARKIEHLVGHLRDRGNDELITVAGNVTNLAFDLLPALDRHRIRATLFIQDEPPVPGPDRERIFAGIRDRVQLVGRRRSGTLARGIAAFARSRARGGRPFLLLPGGSHPAAVIGNACGFLEMVEQCDREGRATPGVVYVTAATGTTVAGLLLAETALRRAGREPIRVVGVQVYPGAIEWWTRGLVRWTERALGMTPMPADRIEIQDTALHGGFADFPDAIADLCDRIRGDGGPALDPVFGGKTWSAMMSDLRAHPPGGRAPLYWHCGYTPEWRTLRAAVRRDRSGS